MILHPCTTMVPRCYDKNDHVFPSHASQDCVACTSVEIVKLVSESLSSSRSLFLGYCCCRKAFPVPKRGPGKRDTMPGN